MLLIHGPYHFLKILLLISLTRWHWHQIQNIAHSVCARSSRGSHVVANSARGHGDCKGDLLGTTCPSDQRFEVGVEPAVDKEIGNAVNCHEYMGQVSDAEKP